MRTGIKIAFAVMMLTSIALSAIADRGMGRKTKSKLFVTNISTGVSLRSSITFNLRSGFSYKNSQSQLNTIRQTPRFYTGNSVLTYQKGNNVLIIPARQRITAMPEMKQGYTGFKLVLGH
jgi:hypothetical protein